MRLPFRASALVFHLRRVIGAVVTLFDLSGDGSVKRYHPEDHYMRGPGPKWRKKRLLDHASTG
jgi:hypothetical protein